MPLTAANGITYSDSQIRAFFASKASLRVIAMQASALGLDIDQIQQAFAIGGQSITMADIVAYAAQNGFSWGPQGALTATASLRADQPPGGMTDQGQITALATLARDIATHAAEMSRASVANAVICPWSVMPCCRAN